MGTTGLEGRGTHAEIDAYLMKPFKRGDDEITFTDCRLVLGHHYHVERVNGQPAAIICAEITRTRASKAKQARGEWGADGAWYVKAIPDTMGPYYVTCPLDLFEIVPEPTGDDQGSKWAREWRQRVRDWHASRSAERARAGSLKLEIGTRVQLRPGLKLGGEVYEDGLTGTIVGFYTKRNGRGATPLMNPDRGLYQGARVMVPRKLIATLLPAEGVK